MTPQTPSLGHDLLLFDLDGTLSDPLPGIGRSLNHALAHYGYECLALSTCAAYIGPPLDHAFRIITGSSSDEHITDLVKKFRERYGEIGYSENTLYPGVREALTELKAAGWELAVCTSKRKDFADKILKMFGLFDHFRFIDGGDVGVAKWEQIGRLLSANAVSSLTLMIGDRAVDLTAAHKNGLSSGGVLWGHGLREELEAEQPRYLFSEPSEWFRILKPAL